VLTVRQEKNRLGRLLDNGRVSVSQNQKTINVRYGLPFAILFPVTVYDNEISAVPFPTHKEEQFCK